MTNENQKEIKIVAHNASFHADDVFAVATILISLSADAKNADKDGVINLEKNENSNKTVKVIRTRHPEEIAEGDYVVDVGGEYDPTKNRYDHHQKGGAGKRENGVPYASFGLVWKHIGPQICSDESLTEEGQLELWQKIDNEIVCAIDANDNGFDLSKMLIEGVYSPSLSLSIMIEKPTWEERGSEAFMYESFMRAVVKAQDFLKRYIIVQLASLRAKKAIIETYNNSENKSIIVFAHDYERINFVKTLVHLPEIIFYIYPDNSGYWSAEAVPTNEDSFEKRKSFPEAWAGLTGVDFEKATGNNDAIFCHNGRFLFKAKTEASAISLAKTALAL